MADDLKLNLGAYTNAKAQGLVRMAKINGQTYMLLNQFTPTGQREQKNIPLSVKSVEDAITNLDHDIKQKQSDLLSHQEALADLLGAKEILDGGKEQK